MKITYIAKGKKRKKLAQAIGNILQADVKYLGAPSFAYQIDYFTLDRDGNLEFDDSADSEEIENLLEELSGHGFEPAKTLTEEENTEAQNETAELTVSMPADKVLCGNLAKLLDAKGNLIKKALGISDLSVRISEDTVSFPWFAEVPDADSVKAYTHFISALCEMSLNAKRVTATEKEVENEKYAFRCFLLRLGFIGKEYKDERKILLRNLSGNSAFRNEQTKEDFLCD